MHWADLNMARIDQERKVKRHRSVDGPTILLASGNYFSFERPDLSEFTIEDVAKGLSNTCRFGGQCARFYSVAEHCWHASRQFSTPRAAYNALMHDAAEAFVGDIPKPLKVLLPDFAAVEQRVEHAVANRFDFPCRTDEPTKLVDRRLLLTEQRQVMGNFDDWNWSRGVDPLPVKIRFWSPGLAELKFLERFAELREKL